MQISGSPSAQGVQASTSELLKVYGDEGNDTVSVGEGNDTLDGGTGIDLMLGSTGNDTYIVDMASDVVSEAKGQGTDTVYSSVNYVLNANVERLTLTDNATVGYGNSLANVLRAADHNSLLYGWGGNDTLYAADGGDRLYGSSGSDRLYGGTGRDSLTGDSGNDVLKGGDGHDTINGGTGNDGISGGKGKDILSGGYGRDAFVFDTKLAKDNVDTIKSFWPSDDIIRLENAIFKNLKTGLFGTNRGWLNADAFHVGSKAAAAEDRIVYNSKTGGLYYDKDGAGGSEQVKFAQLDKHLSLTAWDFQVV